MNAISRSLSLVSIVISDSSCSGCLNNNILGSGITVYNLIWDIVNASFAIDGSSPQSYVHDRSCLELSPPGCYNTSVYDVQSLTFDNHILNITLFSYNDIIGCDFVFDYAIVNDTHPAVVTSSTSSSTATLTGSSTSPNTAGSTGNRAPPNHVSQYVFPSSLAVDS